MSDADFAACFVRYFLEGAEAKSWAALELNLLATYGNEMRRYQVLTTDTQVTGERQQP
jgi:hypothetical protein